MTTTTDTSTTRIMDRAHELEAHGDNGCIADAALLRSLSAERDALRDMTWFWTIVDRDGLTGLPSSEPEALSVLVTRAAERDALAAECARMREALERAQEQVYEENRNAAIATIDAALGARAS